MQRDDMLHAREQLAEIASHISDSEEGLSHINFISLGQLSEINNIKYSLGRITRQLMKMRDQLWEESLES